MFHVDLACPSTRNWRNHIPLIFGPNTWSDAILVTTCHESGENVHIKCSARSEHSRWKINHIVAFFPHYFYFIPWVFWPKVLKKQSWQRDRVHSQTVTDLPSQPISLRFLVLVHSWCTIVWRVSSFWSSNNNNNWTCASMFHWRSWNLKWNDLCIYTLSDVGWSFLSLLRALCFCKKSV